MEKRYNKAEFIKLCQSSGYCTKKEAERCASTKSSFKEADFIAIFQQNQKRQDFQNHRSELICTTYGRTSQKYMDEELNQL